MHLQLSYVSEWSYISVFGEVLKMQFDVEKGIND